MLPGPGGGGTCAGNPGAASYSTNHLWVFCRGGAGHVYAKRYNGSGWQDWQDLGGTLISGTAATEYNHPGHGYEMNVFAVGTDGNLWVNWCKISQGCVWLGWQSLGQPPGGCTSSPAADWRTEFERYALCRAPDQAIWYTKWNGSIWEPWASLGGIVESGPSATDLYVYPSGWRVDVHGNNRYGLVYQNDRSGSGWSNWYQPWTEGYLSSSPGSSNLPPTPHHLFVLGRGGAPANADIFYRRWNGSTWGGWLNIGRPP